MKLLILLALVTFVSFSTVAQKSSESKSTRPLTITGRILDDEGQPLSGVEINASQVGDFRNQTTAVSDAEGKFKLSNLSSSAYIIFARLAAFASPINAMQTFYRPGENVTITLVKGGIITGKVTNAQGDPMPGMWVSATRVRDADGRSTLPRTFSSNTFLTDDRGVYRIYGLHAGSYLVSARNNPNFFAGASDPETPIYFPSTTIDGAQEVSVAAGGEISGIDLQSRFERGNVISGKVTGAIGTQPDARIFVSLTSIATGLTAATTTFMVRSGNLNFVLPRVPDGDYELTASRSSLDRKSSGAGAYATPRKITVKGNDITGVELQLVPTAAIAGRVVLEPMPRSSTCQTSTANSLAEVVIVATSNAPPASLPRTFATEADGTFALSDLRTGQWHLATELPNESWYRKAVTRTQPAVPISFDGLNVKTSETLSGVTITLAAGAASLRGNVKGKAAVVFLIPVEKEAANNEWRYAVTEVSGDGSFAFRNIAPGQYWLLARAEADATKSLRDAESRAQLRRAAETAQAAITLKPCQRVQGFALKFVP